MMIQVILNIAVVTNSIPNTGITLPFISYGGTSVLFLLLEMGLVLSVSNLVKMERRLRACWARNFLLRLDRLKSRRYHGRACQARGFSGRSEEIRGGT